MFLKDFFKFNGFKHGNKIFFLNGFRSENRANSAASYSESTKWKSCDNKWDKELFDKWCSGETGYPFVDANMKELNETGKSRPFCNLFFFILLYFDYAKNRLDVK